MHLFRIHIRPQGGSEDMKATFEYCLKNELLGVGWRLNSTLNTKVWDEYFFEAEKLYGNLQVCKYIKKWVSEGDLVWTRDADGEYYLARVQSGWEYWISPEAEAKDIDIANIFRVKFVKVDIDAVPGKVVACFRAGRTIQEICDERAIEYSKHLWNKLAGKDVYPVSAEKYSDIFMMLDDEETEDLVFLYLQSLGWYVLPNSRKGDTMSFEFLAVNPQTGEKAVSQVKTGNVVLNRDDYSTLSQKVFLFQSNDLYSGYEHDNVVCFSRNEVLKFLNSSQGWMPRIIQRKMELIH